MVEARTLVAGRAEGSALVLDEPLSLWGGLDPRTGVIVDVRHPQRGAKVTGRILVLPSGRGSSSSSSVLAEAIRAGAAPSAIVLAEADPILALGAIVARELYGAIVPVVVASPMGIRTGDAVVVRAEPESARVERDPGQTRS
jgi:predicted aconitase with swiveling domain